MAGLGDIREAERPGAPITPSACNRHKLGSDPSLSFDPNLSLLSEQALKGKPAISFGECKFCSPNAKSLAHRQIRCPNR